MRAVESPRGGDGSVVLNSAFCGICGTDLHIVAGEHPRAQPGIVIGHEFVGVVAEREDGFSPGERVFVNPMLGCGVCDACRRGLGHACPNMRAVGVDVPGGLAEQVAVPAAALRRLPDGLDLQLAALIEPLAVAVRAVRRAELRLADTVHIIGAGPIGRLLAVCAEAAGAGRLTLSEPAPQRRAAAEAAGLELLDEPVEPGADVVFDASGHPAVAPTLTRWARVGARIMVVAAYPPEPVGIDLLQVMFKEIAFVGSRVYTWEDIDAAIALLAAGRLNLDGIVSRVVSLEEAPSAIARLRDGAEVKILVDPRA